MRLVYNPYKGKKEDLNKMFVGEEVKSTGVHTRVSQTTKCVFSVCL